MDKILIYTIFQQFNFQMSNCQLFNQLINLVCPPKFCIIIVFSLSWDNWQSQEKWETSYAEFGGQANKVYYVECGNSEGHFMDSLSSQSKSEKSYSFATSWIKSTHLFLRQVHGVYSLIYLWYIVVQKTNWRQCFYVFVLLWMMNHNIVNAFWGTTCLWPMGGDKKVCSLELAPVTLKVN